jgi:hypothetical protein
MNSIVIDKSVLTVNGVEWFLPIPIYYLELLGDRLLKMEWVQDVFVIVTNIKIYEFMSND